MGGPADRGFFRERCGCRTAKRDFRCGNVTVRYRIGVYAVGHSALRAHGRGRLGDEAFRRFAHGCAGSAVGRAWRPRHRIDPGLCLLRGRVRFVRGNSRDDLPDRTAGDAALGLRRRAVHRRPGGRRQPRHAHSAVDYSGHLCSHRRAVGSEAFRSRPHPRPRPYCALHHRRHDRRARARRMRPSRAPSSGAKNWQRWPGPGSSWRCSSARSAVFTLAFSVRPRLQRSGRSAPFCSVFSADA